MKARPDALAYARSVAETMPRGEAVHIIHELGEFTQREIGELLGVSKTRVQQILDGDAFVERQRKDKRARRRAAGIRAFRCGVCGELGHNRTGHDDFVRASGAP